MNTQEIWFPDLGVPDTLESDAPAHGCIVQETPDGPVVVVEYGEKGTAYPLVTPETHPHLHTILDPGQPRPPLLDAVEALGFTVTTHLHGSPSPYPLKGAVVTDPNPSALQAPESFGYQVPSDGEEHTP